MCVVPLPADSRRKFAIVMQRKNAGSLFFASSEPAM
jgi:hypothetical protein